MAGLFSPKMIIVLIVMYATTVSAPTALDGVSAPAASDGVSTLAAPDGVSALAAPDGVSALAAPDGVSALAAPDEVSAPAAPDGVSALAEANRVSASASADGVSALAEADRVSASAEADEVSALAETDRVSAPAARDGVSALAEADEVSASAEADEVSALAEADDPGDETSCDEEIESPELQDLGEPGDDIQPAFRQNKEGENEGDISAEMFQRGYTAPMTSEAQGVWAASKQILIDQLNEQIRDMEAEVLDQSMASNGVQRCVDSANTAELEARQQAKLVNMLTKNSDTLVDHIDAVEKAASEDMTTTDEHISKLRAALINLRGRMIKAQKDLVEIHECGKVKPLQRLRRMEQERLELGLPGGEKLEKREEPTGSGDGKKKVAVVEAAREPEIGEGAKIETSSLRKLRKLSDGEEKKLVKAKSRGAKKEKQENKHAKQNNKDVDKDNAKSNKDNTGANKDNAKGNKDNAGGGYKDDKVGDSTQQMTNEAQGVWAEAKQVLVDQLGDQINQKEMAVLGETAAIISVQRCVQSASAAGLEARQQSKIVIMLSHNSKQLVDNIVDVQQVASQDLVNSGDLVLKYKNKLESLRLRMTAAQEELAAIQECGKVKVLNRLRRGEGREALMKETSATGREGGEAYKTSPVQAVETSATGREGGEALKTSPVPAVETLAMGQGAPVLCMHSLSSKMTVDGEVEAEKGSSLPKKSLGSLHEHQSTMKAHIRQQRSMMKTVNHDEQIKAFRHEQQSIKESPMSEQRSTNEAHRREQRSIKEILEIEQQLIKEILECEQRSIKEMLGREQRSVKESLGSEQRSIKESPKHEQQSIKEAPKQEQRSIKDILETEQQLINEILGFKQESIKDLVGCEQRSIKEAPRREQRSIKESLGREQQLIKKSLIPERKPPATRMPVQ